MALFTVIHTLIQYAIYQEINIYKRRIEVPIQNML